MNFSHSLPGTTSSFQYSFGSENRIWTPLRIINVIHKMLKTCVSRSQIGKSTRTISPIPKPPARDALSAELAEIRLDASASSTVTSSAERKFV